MIALPLRSFLASAVGGIAFVACLAVAADPPANVSEPPVDDPHDLVFLAEARPVLLRLHVQLDGKPVQAALDDFMQYLFNYLDVNGDHVLSKAEAERALLVDQIMTGGLGRAFGGPGGGKVTPPPTMADFDTDKDGQVTLAELSAYYRKHGLTPLQLQPESGGPTAFGAAAFLSGGRRPEPSVEVVAAAMFDALDTNKDGKLSRAELAVAAEVLLRQDQDDDEMITPAEAAPNAKPPANMLAGMMAMGMGGAGSAKGPKNLISLPAPGTMPPEFPRRLRDVYGTASDDDGEKKLGRKELGLDAATFASLDKNGDGALDQEELAGFVRRAPDLELTMRMGRLEAAGPRVELPAMARAFTSKTKLANDVARLDLGPTRIDLRCNNAYSADQQQLAGILRQQFNAQFKRIDKANNGYIDAKQAQTVRMLGSQFHAMDRDGDGKLYESEVIAYLDLLADLQRRVRTACVSLVLTNQSRGLFDLLDADRDGRLSVREMRGAAKLLDALDHDRKGYLAKADIPRSYQLALRRGPASALAGGGAAFLDLYRRPEGPAAAAERREGPVWFRKMDRNRDGDVSRREFLGTDAQFRALDTDGDGLISAAEADRYDAQSRK